MILIDGETPRWIRELDRFVHLKSLLLVHGNVLDLVSYRVGDSQSDQRYWTTSNLADFFNRYLTGLDYEIVGTFEPLDGLQFATPAMDEAFQRIAGGGASIPGRPGQRTPAGGWVDPDPVVERIARVLANRERPAAFVLHFTSRLLSSPDRLSRQEQTLFTRMLKISLDSREVIRGERHWNNVLVLVCDKINDLPAFLYLDNPRCRSLQVDKPSSADRARFITGNYSSFYRTAGSNAPSADLKALFSALTDGFSYHELLSLVGLSLREHLPVEEIRTLCERYKYGVTESAWDKLDKHRLTRAAELIRGRIKGQEAAVERVLEIVKRAKLGLAAGSGKRSQRPRGVLFFAGPTGVGKTEMAKGLAELLFGEEDRLIRFDMSEYAVAHADQKLLGAPPGYVGYEEGGKLTNAIKAQPFSVLLFDEVEKAHPGIFDKFLQILDDGRLTDNKGETVYFSESIIIFTSNLGTVAASDETAQRELLVSPEMPFPEVRAVILQAIRHHFNLQLGRPEILNRFGDNFVVFDFIRAPADEQILDLLLAQLADSLADQQHLRLLIRPQARDQLIGLCRGYLEHGGRGIRNALDAAVINPLASALFDLQLPPGSILELKGLMGPDGGGAQRIELGVPEDVPGDTDRNE